MERNGFSATSLQHCPQQPYQTIVRRLEPQPRFKGSIRAEVLRRAYPDWPEIIVLQMTTAGARKSECFRASICSESPQLQSHHVVRDGLQLSDKLVCRLNILQWTMPDQDYYCHV